VLISLGVQGKIYHFTSGRKFSETLLKVKINSTRLGEKEKKWKKRDILFQRK
jgi:hypothetical protein